jgi:hypothetical protein
VLTSLHKGFSVVEGWTFTWRPARGPDEYSTNAYEAGIEAGESVALFMSTSKALGIDTAIAAEKAVGAAVLAKLWTDNVATFESHSPPFNYPSNNFKEYHAYLKADASSRLVAARHRYIPRPESFGRVSGAYKHLTQGVQIGLYRAFGKLSIPERLDLIGATNAVHLYHRVLCYVMTFLKSGSTVFCYISSDWQKGMEYEWRRVYIYAYEVEMLVRALTRAVTDLVSEAAKDAKAVPDYYPSKPTLRNSETDELDELVRKLNEVNEQNQSMNRVDRLYHAWWGFDKWVTLSGMSDFLQYFLHHKGVPSSDIYAVYDEG